MSARLPALPSAEDSERVLESTRRRVEYQQGMVRHVVREYAAARVRLSVRRRRVLAGARVRMWATFGLTAAAASSIVVAGWGTPTASWSMAATVVLSVVAGAFAGAVSDRKSMYRAAKLTRLNYSKRRAEADRAVAAEQERVTHLQLLHEANLRLPGRVRLLADALQFPDQTVTAVRTGGGVTLTKPGPLWQQVGRAAGWDDTITVLVEELATLISRASDD